jgi:hypothetical protein
MFSSNFNNYDVSSQNIGTDNQNMIDETRANLNNFFRGVVVSVADPMKLGRARVRVPSLHGSVSGNPNYLPDSMIPWATPAIWSASGNDMGEFNPPTAGSRVFVTFEGGNSQYPIYFGGIPTKIGATKYYKPEVGILMGATQEIKTDDYNVEFITGTERTIFKTFKGATIICNDFDGNEYLKIVDQAGQSIVLANKGDSLPRRGNKLGTSSQSYIEISNNRGEIIKIKDGQVFIDGDETYINSKSVQIPNWKGGGTGGDYYTKEQTDTLLANKSRVFFEEPTVPYTKDDLWYNNNTVYKCITTRKNGSFNIADWQIDSSYMSPEQVTAALTELEGKIRLEMSSTYVTPAYVDDKINYEVFIHSSQGDIFKNGIINTVLTAYVRQGNYDVSSKFNDNQFVWTRSSSDAQGDIEWNRKYIGGSRSITVTTDDVKAKATFNCEIVDTINTVKYIKSGLIEIFDGFDEPTSTGEWQSMIRTNTAIIPSTGVTYDSAKHGYLFSGSNTAMQLYKPISLVKGYTYEFVTNLSSYSSTQNIISSNETDNDSINTRIACAVAGHLQVRKNGFTLNAGDVKINRMSCVSIRFADEDNMEIYYNGDYAGKYTQSGWLSEPSSMTLIGKYCSGYIHSFRVYNRLLTPSEIETNYNEDVTRFL